jgi:hypothetical protein
MLYLIYCIQQNDKKKTELQQTLSPFVINLVERVENDESSSSSTPSANAILIVQYPTTNGSDMCLHQCQLEQLCNDKSFKAQIIVFFAMRYMMMANLNDNIPETTVLFDDSFGSTLFYHQAKDERDIQTLRLVLRHCENVHDFFSKIKLVVFPIHIKTNHYAVLVFSPQLYHAKTESSVLFLDSYVPKKHSDSFIHSPEFKTKMEELNSFLAFLSYLSTSEQCNVKFGMKGHELKQARNNCGFYNDNDGMTAAHKLSAIDISKYIPVDERQSVPTESNDDFEYRDYNCALYAGVYAYTLSITSDSLYKCISLPLSDTDAREQGFSEYFQINKWNEGIGVNMSNFREKLRETLIKEVEEKKQIIEVHSDSGDEKITDNDATRFGAASIDDEAPNEVNSSASNMQRTQPKTQLSCDGDNSVHDNDNGNASKSMFSYFSLFRR